MDRFSQQVTAIAPKYVNFVTLVLHANVLTQVVTSSDYPVIVRRGETGERNVRGGQSCRGARDPHDTAGREGASTIRRVRQIQVYGPVRVLGIVPDVNVRRFVVTALVVTDIVSFIFIVIIAIAGHIQRWQQMMHVGSTRGVRRYDGSPGSSAIIGARKLNI